MKVLITGCTAQQASPRTAQRTPTFSSLLAKALQDGGIDANVVDPSIHMTEEDLREYDSVIVGIAPPTSLSANKIYPAFAIANRARKIGNLILFIDAPEPYKLQASLKSVSMNVADLTKDFYGRRKSYSDLVDNSELRAEVYEFCEFLYTQEWPVTLFPALPWSNPRAILQALPNLDDNNLVPISVDSYLLKAPYSELNLSTPREYWTCDAVGTKWSTSVRKTLQNSVISSRESRWEKEVNTVERIKSSVGTLISVYRSNDPWWSPTLAQSLSLGVPVVTDWRHSAVLGNEWSQLASSVEEMSVVERHGLAVSQKEAYLSAIPTWDQTIKDMINIISSTSKALIQ
jgi:hypothetical protein